MLSEWVQLCFSHAVSTLWSLRDEDMAPVKPNMNLNLICREHNNGQEVRGSRICSCAKHSLSLRTIVKQTGEGEAMQLPLKLSQVCSKVEVLFTVLALKASNGKQLSTGVNAFLCNDSPTVDGKMIRR